MLQRQKNIRKYLKKEIRIDAHQVRKSKENNKTHTLFNSRIDQNNQRSINKAQKVMTIHIINNVRVPYI